MATEVQVPISKKATIIAFTKEDLQNVLEKSQEMYTVVIETPPDEIKRQNMECDAENILTTLKAIEGMIKFVIANHPATGRGLVGWDSLAASAVALFSLLQKGLRKLKDLIPIDDEYYNFANAIANDLDEDLDYCTVLSQSAINFSSDDDGDSLYSYGISASEGDTEPPAVLNFSSAAADTNSISLSSNSATLSPPNSNTPWWKKWVKYSLFLIAAMAVGGLVGAEVGACSGVGLVAGKIGDTLAGGVGRAVKKLTQ